MIFPNGFDKCARGGVMLNCWHGVVETSAMINGFLVLFPFNYSLKFILMQSSNVFCRKATPRRCKREQCRLLFSSACFRCAREVTLTSANIRN
jgi:hypothetical protein